jgi:hypothetical protein
MKHLDLFLVIFQRRHTLSPQPSRNFFFLSFKMKSKQFFGGAVVLDEASQSESRKKETKRVQVHSKRETIRDGGAFPFDE